MKRLLALLLSMVMFLTLCDCPASNSDPTVEEKIALVTDYGPVAQDRNGQSV